ncbi:DUF4148 domain-containing protein [Bordetella sp. 15P40C-2]|uniref:DUF4148 domain-containing protein n=1 Tax=Bordetella sp. 15P40C-2 TaxID=2572246 RepID=UPI0013226912|nr:DUF4148 domain-containing protein [Bordetella sp. 15P40C-2]MVW70060.1 DUF4148 domain-containing protein [Bordetella sp. 15P40C-2]
MKTLLPFALIAAALSSNAAFAQEPSGELDYPPAVSTESHVTRAQVIQELQEARAAGLVTFGELEEPQAQVAASTKTRAQVQAEAARARTERSQQSSLYGFSYTGA